MTNCQVSEKLNSGPVTAQTSTTDSAIKKADDEPMAVAVHDATRRKRSFSGARQELAVDDMTRSQLARIENVSVSRANSKPIARTFIKSRFNVKSPCKL